MLKNTPSKLSSAKKFLALASALALASGMSIPFGATKAQASSNNDDSAQKPIAFMDADNPIEEPVGISYVDAGDNVVPQELIVTYEDDIRELDEVQVEYVAPNIAYDAMGPVMYEQVDVSLESIGAVEQSELGDSPKMKSEALVRLEDGVDMNEAIEEISDLDGVVAVQPNYVYKAMSANLRVSQYSDDEHSLPTNDHYALYNPNSNGASQRYLYNTHIACLWDNVRGDGSGTTNTGVKVSIAVMDTEIRFDHPDLINKLDIENGRDFRTNTNLNTDGKYGDPITNANTADMSAKWDNNTFSKNEHHGTCVAGYLGAQANNEEGIAGGSYNANIIPITVSEDGNFTTTSVISALKYIDKLIENNSALNLHVLNMSFGGTGNGDSAMHTWIQHLYSQHDVLCVAAAGNVGGSIPSADSVVYPAAWDEVLSVMSTDSTGSAMPSFTCHGEGTDVSAPGSSVTSTHPWRTSGSYTWNTSEALRYKTTNMNGTSFAAPIVAGGAALLFVAKPDATAKQIKNAIVSTARDMTNVNANCRPFVDMEAAYCELMGMEAPAEDETYVPPVHVHNWVDSVVTTEPTCETLGIKQQSCTGCDETQNVEIPALGHNWSAPEWEWSNENTICAATFTCLRDQAHTERIYAEVEKTEDDDNYIFTAALQHGGQTFTRVTTMPKTSTPTPHVHSWGNFTVVTQASCTASGKEIRSCSGCGETEERIITALDHRWSATPVWEWASDVMSCSVTFTCERDSAHTTTLEVANITHSETDDNYVHHASITFQGSLYEDEVTTDKEPAHQHTWAREAVTVQPSCTSTGVRTYYCQCGEIKTEEIPAVGHVWQEPSWAWNSDHSSCTATFQCKNNSSHTTSYKAVISSKQEGNKTIYTAVVATTEGKTYVTTAEVISQVVTPDPDPNPGTDPDPKPENPDPKPETPEPPAENQLIADGIYMISTALSPSKLIDISGGSVANYANVQLWSSNGTDAQKFKITYEKSTNSYIITNLLSNKPIQVSGTVKNGANVNQQAADGKKSQRWKITKESSGYKIASLANTSIVLDLSGALTNNGRNIQVWASNNTKAQRWNLTKVTLPAAVIADGTYYINSQVGANKVLDINGASTANGANAQIWTKNNTAAQRFSVVYNGRGYYTIKNVKSGKVLDAKCGGTTNGTNIWQYAANGTDAQQWKIVKNSDNTYTITNRKSGKVLDVNAAANRDGANVHIWASNGTKAQKWMFTKA